MKKEISKSELVDMYDDVLDELYEPMFNISPSLILRRADPIQYDCGLNDYYDSLTYDDYYCEEME